jgi:hypothetical protein
VTTRARQGDLFDPPSRAPHTSRAAARQIRGDPARSQRLRLHLFLEGCGERGATQEEAATRLRMGRPSCCARFWELERCGLAIKTDRTRPTASGRAAIVYVYRSIVP